MATSEATTFQGSGAGSPMVSVGENDCVEAVAVGAMRGATKDDYREAHPKQHAQILEGLAATVMMAAHTQRRLSEPFQFGLELNVGSPGRSLQLFRPPWVAPA